jgi:Beta-lactamase enzyme family
VGSLPARAAHRSRAPQIDTEHDLDCDASKDFKVFSPEQEESLLPRLPVGAQAGPPTNRPAGHYMIKQSTPTMPRLVLALLLFTSATANAATSALGDKQQVLWERLHATLSGIEQQLDGVLGVAILDLTTGQQLLMRPDEVFPQASSIKIAVLAELYHQAEQAAAGTPSKAKLTDPYVVRTSDLVPDSSIMGGLTPGVTAPRHDHGGRQR